MKNKKSRRFITTLATVMLVVGIGLKLFPLFLIGTTHITYTSLPIGKEDTNCVLAGHTGEVGRIFFDNI